MFPPHLARFLKSQLTTQILIESNYTADFWEMIVHAYGADFSGNTSKYVWCIHSKICDVCIQRQLRSRKVSGIATYTITYEWGVNIICHICNVLFILKKKYYEFLRRQIYCYIFDHICVSVCILNVTHVMCLFFKPNKTTNWFNVSSIATYVTTYVWVCEYYVSHMWCT